MKQRTFFKIIALLGALALLFSSALPILMAWQQGG
jgi:hypothetical protein